MRAALERLADSEDLPTDAVTAVFRELMAGRCDPVQIGALLMGLAQKGESLGEIVGAARAMRETMDPVRSQRAPLLDTCGTGGSGLARRNVSTAVALAVAACGVAVAKHGNRAASSRSGSADVLDVLGVNLHAEPETVGRSIDALGIGFLFAPSLHPAMKHVANARRMLGVRTIFNLLGPLANPAQAPYAVIGAWNLEVAKLMSATLAGMPIERMFVVHGDGGWDEPTPATPFTLLDVRPGSVTQVKRTAADFGLPACRDAELKGGDAVHNAGRLAAVLRGEERGAHRDALVMGAALVAEVTGLAPDAGTAAQAAAAAIDDGRAARLLDGIVAFSRERAG